MTEHQERGRQSVGDDVREGIRAGLGILSALKDALEETIQEMADRGELSQDRAREAVRTTMDRAQAAFEDARVRLEFVPRREFESLKAEVADLRARLARHETDHPRSGPSAAAPDSGASEPATGPGGDIPITES
jgi:polyhydroxyalkanoate synthesis regulator phasin